MSAARLRGGALGLHRLAAEAPAKGSHVTTALVVVVHDLAWRRNPEATTGRGRRWHEKSLRRAIARADALVVPSDLVAADLVAAGASRAAVTVIPTVRTPRCPEPPGGDRLLERNGVTRPLPARRRHHRAEEEPGAPRRRLPRGRPRPAGPLALVVVGATGWGSVGQVEAPGSPPSGR